MLKKIKTSNAPNALGPYSQAIVISPASLVYVSGQLPIDPATGKLVEGDIRLLTKRVLENIKAILVASGSDFQFVTRVEVFLKDLKKDFAAMNEEYAVYFNGENPPARQTIQPAELPMGSPIEISCIAVVP